MTFDADGNLKTINWRALVVGLQYYLPFADGRIWVSANYSQLKSTNIVSLTPENSRGGVFYWQDYFDANAYAAVTPAVQLGISYQYTHQVFGDRPQFYGTAPSAPTPIEQPPRRAGVSVLFLGGGAGLPSRDLPVVGEVDGVGEVDVAPFAVHELDRPADEAAGGVQLVAGGRRACASSSTFDVVDLGDGDVLAQLDRSRGRAARLVSLVR